MENKSAIIEKWCALTLQTYPEESQRFFTKKDQFGNPVGYNISEGLPLLFDALVENTNREKVPEVLDSIIRIRAIQEFSPSGAVSFVLGLKSVIREELGKTVFQNGLSEDWEALEAEIDSLALLGFDLYAACRQKLYDIRVMEVKKQSDRLLQMAGLTFTIPEWEGDQKEDGPGTESKKNH